MYRGKSYPYFEERRVIEVIDSFLGYQMLDKKPSIYYYYGYDESECSKLRSKIYRYRKELKEFIRKNIWLYNIERCKNIGSENYVIITNKKDVKKYKRMIPDGWYENVKKKVDECYSLEDFVDREILCLYNDDMVDKIDDVSDLYCMMRFIKNNKVYIADDETYITFPTDHFYFSPGGLVIRCDR